MTLKLNLVYASISCYNDRTRMDFGADRRDGSVKVRRITGPTTRFSNIVVDLNRRLIRGRGKATLHSQGWTYFPNRTRRHA